MSRPGIKPGPPAWEASTLEKSYPDSLLMAIRNIYSTYELVTTFILSMKTRQPKGKNADLFRERFLHFSTKF
jgi:hypothetical protein